MGVVWAARDERAGRAVALKILANAEASAPGTRKRFLREAHATRAVAHPAIVPVSEVVEADDMLVLAMELLLGETLRARLAREERITPTLTAGTLLPIAEALSAAHGAGIVHRDLKPENIFLQADGEQTRARLLDFGIARFYEPPADGGRTPITAHGMLLGTIPYMAPEQALSASDCDHEVDAWALGVIAYEALSGCRPIEGNTPTETLRHLLLAAITPLHVVAPDLPKEVSDFVMGLLVRERAQRTTCRAAAAWFAEHAARP